jgi:TetR/AcrR family transcriptional regulator, cholesterol catabolism regulator
MSNTVIRTPQLTNMTTILQSGKPGSVIATSRRHSLLRAWESGVALSTAREILDPAAALFAEKGFMSTSTQEIADLVGVAKPTLYSYAGSKARILEAIFEFVLDVSQEVLDLAMKEVQVEDTIRRILELWTGFSAQYPPAYATVYLSSFHYLPLDAQARTRERATRQARQIRDVLREGQRSGALSPGFDPGAIAFSIVSLSSAFGQWFALQSDLDRGKVASEFLNLTMEGIRNRQGSNSPDPLLGKAVSTQEDSDE